MSINRLILIIDDQLIAQVSVIIDSDNRSIKYHRFLSIINIRQSSIIPSTDVIQLTLTLKMTTTQVVETSVTVNNNSPIQDYVHPDNQIQPFKMTPGFEPFTINLLPFIFI